jgi:uncharacterized DUF497 family protein
MQANAPVSRKNASSIRVRRFRDIAIGRAGQSGILFVVNTIRGDEEQEIIRIISARPATKVEKREYARANGAAKA